jgi:hypothetical protein
MMATMTLKVMLSRIGIRPRVKRTRFGLPALLAVVLIFTFPHAAGGELNPINVSGVGASGSAPRIASDGAGNMAAVWRELDGDTSSIRASLQPKGQPWGSPQQISLPAAATEGPKLAMDRSGNAVAVWHSSSDGHNSSVQAAVRPVGGDWSAPQDLSAPGEAAFNADVAVEAGRATAVWTVMHNSRPVVQSSSRTIAGTWEAAETISAQTGAAYLPVIAMDDQGGAVASWQWWDGAYRVIQAALRPADGVWSAPEELSGPGRGASAPRVAMDASGNALVGWVRSNGSWTAAQIASRPAGGVWGPPRNLSERGGNARSIEIAMNRRGDAAVSWVQRQLSVDADLWSSFRAAGAARWSRVPVTETWSGLQAQIALDEVGNATAVWAGSFTISASFKPTGKPWQDDYLLSGFDSPAAQPAVTTQTPRNATAIWVILQESQDRIQAVSYDVDTSAKEAEDEEGDDEGDDEGDEEEAEGLGARGEKFEGTRLADVLVGTPGNDVFFGYSGNDSIDGRGGRDVVYGGPGRDRILGGDGRDRLIGGPGRDRIAGGRGRDLVDGGDGSDVLSGNSGNDVFMGFAGNDWIDGRGGRDVVHGGLGNDRIMGGEGADRLFGGSGDDRIFGGRGSDVLAGDHGRDVLSGNSGDDILRARDLGPDWAFGGTGLDQYRLDRWLDQARSIESRL